MGGRGREAAAEDATPPEIIPAAAEDSAASTVVSALLFVAFCSLGDWSQKAALLPLSGDQLKEKEINLRKRRQKRRRREERKQRPRRGLDPEGLAGKLKKMKNKHDIYFSIQ
ncbi:hypothetical protein C4D60_Mb09t03570 [Musa balbisiana]|uniref:Uncharacterized protein n=1 Tax=Musa balbisiana TaxID=52838 RepID=A0A4S8IDU0_MUSBA|nr:hypothetical protein C4D60_Mb09t03570 [Musa balbisiana]